MNEKDYSPLSAACVRALNDKLYEKRKVAATEIEKLMKDYVQANNTAQIKKLLYVLKQEFAFSQNQNSRKGGLIGLAAAAIALGKDSNLYVNDLVKPVLSCFHDSDSRVRYYGCEALYNIIKITRASAMPFFNDIFDGLSKLAADPDHNVRNGSELLDRLMKDIVIECDHFDLVAFVPLLRERIQTKNTFARQFILSWIKCLDAVPNLNLLNYLSELLDGLFQMLSDPNQEIRQMCLTTLNEFLENINKSESVDFHSMANILILHSQSLDSMIQSTAIVWLLNLLELSGNSMLVFSSGILSATLACLAYEDEARLKIRDISYSVIDLLMELITGFQRISDPKYKMKRSEEAINNTPTDLIKDMSVSSIVVVLSTRLVHESVAPRMMTLKIIYALLCALPQQMLEHVNEIFPLLLKTLSDNCDEIVILTLSIFAEISTSNIPESFSNMQNKNMSPIKNVSNKDLKLNLYFKQFLESLVGLFKTDQHLLDDKASYIIRELCLLLDCSCVYIGLSEILFSTKDDDIEFVRHFVHILNSILMTSTELFELRMLLKTLDSDKKCDMFISLYKCWCHNSVAALSLTLLTQNYSLASALIKLFSNIEVTLEFLSEVDQLVQLIESPMFSYLRLHLLDPVHSTELSHTLYALLMLLPQSDAFKLLYRRLKCVPTFNQNEKNTKKKKVPTATLR